MKFQFLLYFFICFLTFCRGEGFFSKLTNRNKYAAEVNEGKGNVCETVRVMPRIVFAIVGGSTLKSDISAPYIVAIGEILSNRSVSWYCGGSLLSSRHVLTAAHCLISRNATSARLGSFSARERQTRHDYAISETIIHPDYKITESYNDIAIVKLKEKVDFSENLKPVCLPENDREKHEEEIATVIGWGAEEFGGEGTQKLKQVRVKVFKNRNCEKAYENSTIAPKIMPEGLKNNQLCAGSSAGGKDACQGDSGGPLVLRDDDGIVRQIGIVSTGAGCGFRAYPGVYTRVSSYVDWIRKNVQESDNGK